MSIAVSSSAFAEGETIPRRHTGEGEDCSPPLAWTDVPPGTVEFALICDDPDAPTEEPWVHWVLYGLPATVHSLPEGLPADGQLAEPAGARQGKNSWPSGRTLGYRGPMPPPGHGPHHYHFTLYALSKKLSAEPGLQKTDLLRRIQGSVLGTGRLIGVYERK